MNCTRSYTLRYRYAKSDPDREAIADDWQTIGGDLAIAIKGYGKTLKTSSER